ncbi:LysR family transcriptional regulator [Paenibacillus camelliae]|uniref:LysR family transcriptional regulator n=1 Tax=Paenibacillus camelliae TaxID=512410 RepID=UPI00203D1C82|nr:LysR family transcriptional regulator [Paenibacillus camelliae]MCM3634314.1 LysR family transcriptional regulator [Paenibacillus camelliae]
MDLLSLRYFQVVANVQSMTKAAEILHISQPALSKMIKHLENELTVELFDRTGKYIRLNEYGRRFLEKVNLSLQTLEDGKQELLDLAERSVGTIVILVQVGSYLLPDMITKFRELHPGVQFKLLLHDQDAATYPLFDLCISSAPFRIPGTSAEQLLTEDIMLALPSDHRYAERKSIRLDELAKDGFISLKSGKRLRETTDLLCRTAGFTPQIVYECDDPAMVRSLVQAGLGICFYPAITWGKSGGTSVILLPIEDVSSKRTIEISWYSKRYMSNIARAFKSFVQEYYKQLN